MLLKHIFRNIKENKVRGLLIIVSLMLSTIVIFMNFVIKDNITNRYKQTLYGTYQNYDILIGSEKGNSYFEKSEINMKGLDVNKQIYTNSTYGLINKEDDELNIILYGVDLKEFTEGKLLTLEEGKLPEEHNPYQIIIDKKTAEEYGYKLKDNVSIDTAVGTKEFTISAIAKNSGLYTQGNNNVLFMADRNSIDDIFDLEGKINGVLVDLKENTNVEESIKVFENNNGNDFKVSALINNEAIEANLNLVNQMLLIILVVVLLLNYYVVSSNSKMIVETRMSVMGTFRSIGATKRKVAWLLIGENIMYGLIGGVLGVFVGFLIREPIIAAFVENAEALNTDGGISVIDITFASVSILVTVVLQILYVIKSVMRLTNMSIKNTIFEKVDAVQNLSKFDSVFGVILIMASVGLYLFNVRYNFTIAVLAFILAIWGVIRIIPLLIKYISSILYSITSKVSGPIGLGFRNISYSKTVASNVTLISITLSIMLIIYMLSLSLSSMFGDAKNLFEADIQIKGLQETQQEYEFLNKVDGVTDVKPIYHMAGKFKLDGTDTQLVVAGFDKAQLGIYDKSGATIKDIKDKEALVDEYYALRNNIKIGDSITLESENMLNESIKVKVTGFVDARMFTALRNVIVMNENYYIENLNNIPATLNVMVSKDLAEAKKLLKKELVKYNVSVETVDEYIKMQEQSVGGIISLVWVILFFSIVLAAIGIINNQVLGFAQRRREYAILYSVSMSKSQLKNMLIAETFGIFTTGCILGVGLGLWLKSILKSLLFSIGLYLNININYNSLLVTLGIMLMTMLLASNVPIRMISKMNVIKEIKYE